MEFEAMIRTLDDAQRKELKRQALLWSPLTAAEAISNMPADELEKLAGTPGAILNDCSVQWEARVCHDTKSDVWIGTGDSPIEALANAVALKTADQPC